MRKQWWLRPFAAAMAVWLSLTLGEPGIVHVCPAHSAPAAATAASSHDATHAHGSPEQSPPRHDHATCTCLGTCCVSAFGAVVPAPVARVAARVVLVRGAVPQVTVGAPRRAPARLLPFANGPPALVTAA